MAAQALSRAMQSLSVSTSTRAVALGSGGCAKRELKSLSLQRTSFLGLKLDVSTGAVQERRSTICKVVTVASTAVEEEEEETEEEIAALRIPFATHRILATGRRKTAVARVALVDGTGHIFVNGIPAAEYFQGSPLSLSAVKLPMSSLGYETRYDVIVLCHGGGLSAQAQAVMMGIARALCKANQANRTPLKLQGLLTRDARAVERKKYGLKKARKAPQFSKR